MDSIAGSVKVGPGCLFGPHLLISRSGSLPLLLYSGRGFRFSHSSLLFIYLQPPDSQGVDGTRLGSLSEMMTRLFAPPKLVISHVRSFPSFTLFFSPQQAMKVGCEGATPLLVPERADQNVLEVMM